MLQKPSERSFGRGALREAQQRLTPLISLSHWTKALKSNDLV